MNFLWFYHIILELLNFPLEVIGADLCGYNFKLLFVFFSSQKEASERAGIREKTSHTRSSEEEDSPDSLNTLVRVSVSENLLINLIF